MRLCGICTKQKPIFIVTEYMKHGALILYLRKYKKTLIRQHQSLINICAQVASGMAYLEQQQFIHRDLASRNCLVGANGEVKVSDFGMSKFMDSSSYQGNLASMIPIYSVPPEVLSKRLFSSKSDVWAFGLLMWEVFTCGDAPYGSLRPHEVRKFVEKGYILDQPDAAKYEDYNVSGMQRMGHCIESFLLNCTLTDDDPLLGVWPGEATDFRSTGRAVEDDCGRLVSCDIYFNVLCF